MALWDDPMIILTAIGAAWIITQIVSWAAARWVIGRAQDFSEDQRTLIQAHFDGRLIRIEHQIGDIEAQVAAIKAPELGPLEANIRREIQVVQADVEARTKAMEEFVAAKIENLTMDLSGTFTQIGNDMRELPKRIQMAAMSASGVEVNALQGYMDREGGPIEKELTMAEALMSEDPRLIGQMAIQKVLSISPSDKYQADHPILAAVFEAGKAMVIPRIQEAFMSPAETQKGRRQLTTGSQTWR